jgi:hypothetical protein
MGKNEKTPITVNDTEYFVEDMTDGQRTMLNHDRIHMDHRNMRT